MILGIGIDTVHIHRFTDWHTKTKEQLQKLLSEEEIAYCLSGTPAVNAERFAVRFAAREAFFKAYQAALHTKKQDGISSLLSVNKHVAVQRNENGLPLLHVNWHALLLEHSSYLAHLSLTHTKETATAIVLIEETR